MFLLVDNSDAIYQFTIIIIFITALVFFVSMYWYSLSLQRSITEREQARQSLKINALELERTRLRNEKLAADNKVRDERNLRLEQEIILKNNELVSSTLLLGEQNRLMTEIQDLVSQIKVRDPEQKSMMKRLQRLIKSNQTGDNQWDNFRLQFDKVHPNFFKELRSNYPKLTQNDIRHCAFIKMRLTTKEIAQLMNINPTSVQISRVRLKKKMALPSEVDLKQFILNI